MSGEPNALGRASRAPAPEWRRLCELGILAASVAVLSCGPHGPLRPSGREGPVLHKSAAQLHRAVSKSGQFAYGVLGVAVGRSLECGKRGSLRTRGAPRPRTRPWRTRPAPESRTANPQVGGPEIEAVRPRGRTAQLSARCGGRADPALDSPVYSNWLICSTKRPAGVPPVHKLPRFRHTWSPSGGISSHSAHRAAGFFEADGPRGRRFPWTFGSQRFMEAFQTRELAPSRADGLLTAVSHSPSHAFTCRRMPLCTPIVVKSGPWRRKRLSL